MLVTGSLFLTAAGAFGIALLGWVLYENVFHPAWRKERTVKRACAKAFGEEDYELVRLHIRPDEPSGADLLHPLRAFFLPNRSEGPPRYYTYDINVVGNEEPDFSEMRWEEVKQVQHYLRRERDVTHHGKKVLHSGAKEEATELEERRRSARLA